jgi:hypothetical protein
VQKHDRRRLPWPHVTQMQPYARDLNQIIRCPKIGRLQRRAWTVGRIKPERQPRQRGQKDPSNPDQHPFHTRLDAFVRSRVQYTFK